MKSRAIMQCFASLLFCLNLSAADLPALDKSVAAEERFVNDDAKKRYFLIRHQLKPEETPKEFALLLILPGGPGSADFLPFCANVITALGTPKDFIVAQLVAPVWGETNAATVVWPGKAFPNKDARFTTEEFIDDVIKDVSGKHRIREGWVFTLGWSSSGHALYSSSFENPKIHGSFIGMSRFQPAWFAHPENAKGKRYYFWHSPDDAICPYAESELAAAFLKQLGASTQHKSYAGGHGWRPNTFYADRIKEALEWFRAENAADEKKSDTIEGKEKK